ncbi:hypothetical protein BK131_03545 [Paenibacillus amylolyticus]|uniref:Uncharacterized protein n=1 Tax=Paenibacillus amylolyticus TaxID=1451 RepID=A0A1R1C4M8_PAEAM|nr:hypothetical protein [Paenibacillus amylolyticus]OMF17060.1 hypothetical protein BK131_03545 [Paenibacillus amylolyticus]
MPTLDNFSLGNYGLGGSSPIKFASGGPIAPSASNRNFAMDSGNVGLVFLQVTDLPFRPNRIIIRLINGAGSNVNSIYNFLSRSAAPTQEGTGYNFYTTGSGGSSWPIRVYEYSTGGIPSITSNAYITADSFLLPVTAGGAVQYVWEAFLI